MSPSNLSGGRDSVKMPAAGTTAGARVLSAPDAACIAEIQRAMRAAGDAILAVRARGPVRSDVKDDGSPVTEADRRADAILVPALQAIDPATPVVSEERQHPADLDARARHWLIDPLDGTRSFLAGGDDFTVNVGLVLDGEPVFGSMLDPVGGRFYWGGTDVAARVADADGNCARLRVRRCPAEGPTVLTSRWHEAAFERRVGRIEGGRREAMSSALKFCRVAEGTADLYPRPGRTMEWDTAAGHAIVLAAGGAVSQLTGGRLRYGKPSRENPSFLVEGSPEWRRFLRPVDPSGAGA